MQVRVEERTIEAEGTEAEADSGACADPFRKLVDMDERGIVVAEGRFVEARGMGISEDGRTASPVLPDDEAGPNAETLIWMLAWTIRE